MLSIKNRDIYYGDFKLTNGMLSYILIPLDIYNYI